MGEKVMMKGMVARETFDERGCQQAGLEGGFCALGLRLTSSLPLPRG